MAPLLLLLLLLLLPLLPEVLTREGTLQYHAILTIPEVGSLTKWPDSGAEAGEGCRMPAPTSFRETELAGYSSRLNSRTDPIRTEGNASRERL